MIGRPQTGMPVERVRRRRGGAGETVRLSGGNGGLSPAYGANSLLLMQFRQFCERLLEGRDRLERLSLSPRATPVVAEAPTPSAAEAAVIAAQAAIAAAQAEAAAKIAAALGQTDEAATVPPAATTAAASAPWLGDTDRVAVERDAVRAGLLALMEQQIAQATLLGGSFALGMLREAQFVMAALADEQILTARWTGKQGWRLLEEELFRSHASGDLFFVRLDTLLALGDAGSLELAVVYFQALSLDFKGRYRNNDPTGQLARYRRQLFLRIYRTPPELARGGLTVASDDFTAEDGQVVWLPHPYRWWGGVAGVVLLWLVTSLVVWEAMTSNMSTLLNHIDASTHRRQR